MYFDKLFRPIMNENVNMVTNILESFNQLFKGKFNGQILYKYLVRIKTLKFPKYFEVF